jgi:hypothetical protein
MQGTGHAGYMREKKRAYKGLVGKPEGKRSLGIFRLTILENSTTVDLKNRMGCFELDISG